MCLLQYNLNYHIDRSEVPARKYSSATVMTFADAYVFRRPPPSLCSGTPLAGGGMPSTYIGIQLKCHNCSFTYLPQGLRSESAQGPSEAAAGSSIEQVSSLSDIDQKA